MPCLRHVEEFATPSAAPHHSPDLPLLPVEMDLSVAFDFAQRAVEGTALITLESTREGARSLRLDAVDFQRVDLGCEGRACNWRSDGRVIHLTLAEGVPRGERVVLRVDWRVVRPVAGLLWGPEGTSSFVASDHESERARHWLPCVDHPAVRTTVTWRLRAPATMTALGTGTLLGTSDHGDGTRTTTWHLSERCPSYLLCVAVGEFRRVELASHEAHGKTVPITLFGEARHEPATLLRSLGKTKSIMDWITGKLDAPFPFPKYFQFVVPGIGGAMENISLTSWDDVCLFDEAQVPTWRLRVDVVNVHEMAHSYFGDSLVVRDFSHVWLKESWATFMEGAWVEDHLGRDEYDHYLGEDARDYRKEALDRYARPIVTRRFDTSWDMYDQHLYPGGAMRIHMLRRLLGDEAFWRGVRTYVRRHTGGLVETDDFRRALEEASGRSLTRFFELWFLQAGHPILKASWTWEGERGLGRLVVEQTQVDDKRGIGLFDLTLPVWVETSGGWRHERLELRGARHELELKLTESPPQVLLDPMGDVLAGIEFAPGDDLLVRSLREGPTVHARSWAARSLAKSGKRTAICALDSARTGEPFWGVRVEMARALQAAGTREAAAILARWIQEEADERVIVALAEACGVYREGAVRDALLGTLARPLSSFTRGALARALGAMRDDLGVDRLLQLLAETPSFWGHLERGALWALGDSRSVRAVSPLIEHAAGPGRRQERLAAIDALGTICRWLPAPDRSRVRDTLTALLRDADYGIRQAAIRAQCASGEPDVGRVEAALRTLADQDVPRLAKLLATARPGGDGGATEKLTKRVEELEERVRTLRAQAESKEQGTPSS